MPVSITVVTPSYNQAKYLEETLRSVVSQRDQVHEYFVFDGGSSDGSVDLIRKYEPYIDHWVSAKDAGQSDAIHKGFSRATGDILCWLNSDDVFAPGVLAKVRAAFEEHPEWDVLTGYHASIDADSRIRSLHRIPGESLNWARWGVLHVCQQTCFFRRSLYEKVGGLRLDLHCVMDGELWCRMLAAGSKWGHLPEYMAAFRQHADAKNSSWLDRYAREFEMMYAAFPDFFRPSVKHRVGLNAYRALQVLSGRHLRALADSKRLRGKRFTEVFGEWPAPVGRSDNPAADGAR